MCDNLVSERARVEQMCMCERLRVTKLYGERLCGGKVVRV